GNFVCVTVIVVLGARARRAVVARQSRKRELVSTGSAIGTGAAGLPAEDLSAHTPAEAAPPLGEGADDVQVTAASARRRSPTPRVGRSPRGSARGSAFPGRACSGRSRSPLRSRRRSSSAPA